MGPGKHQEGSCNPQSRPSEFCSNSPKQKPRNWGRNKGPTGDAVDFLSVAPNGPACVVAQRHCLAGAPVCGAEPWKLHRDLFQCPRVWLLQIKAQIVPRCSSRNKSTQQLGRTPAGPTKSQTVSLEHRLSSSKGLLSQSAGVLCETTGGCCGRGTEVWAWLHGQSRGGKGPGRGVLPTFQPHRPGCLLKIEKEKEEKEQSWK